MEVVVLISIAVTAIVYNLHSMTLNESGVMIKNWGSLFFSSETHCDWNEIEDLSVQRGGLLAFVGGYGNSNPDSRHRDEPSFQLLPTS
ncbi:hypothetical protein ACH49M_19035 [Rhodococcus qingshengii]|uniref:hypothetical protein n=1 Tax=Rhodococcus TaxID=1827 RepID=UPI0009C250BF|nr:MULTISPECIES: hypothetical protein [Rhodococcus]ARE33949.1 hypothetical protein A0W34_11935 [Rhodococcus sp. BH4]MCQ4151664.1 hypothetical protein [Rhodococcus qingshengii]NHE63247.1 hypothetical protein [Rhodococcus sp. D-46]